jgi:hypothetical protein
MENGKNFFSKIISLFYKKKIKIKQSHSLKYKMFFRFLKHNKAYRNYIDELTKDKSISFRTSHNEKHLKSPENFIILQTHFDPYYLINNAFQWRDTKQGIYYWYELNNKWVNALNKLNEIVEK